MQWSWARDVNGRDRDVNNFSQDETETRVRYVSRPSRNRDVETKTTTLGSGYSTVTLSKKGHWVCINQMVQIYTKCSLKLC